MNDMKFLPVFKILFGIGLLVLLGSLFLEWYSLRVFDISENLESRVCYFVFFEMNIAKNEMGINNIFSQNTFMPFFLSVAFILSIIMSLFSLIFIRSLKNQRSFSTAASLTFIITLYYVIVFPSLYLLPNDLYFPFLKTTESTLQIQLTYGLGIGYYMQIIGFLLIFPLTVYSYQSPLIEQDQNEEDNSKLEEFLLTNKDNADLRKFIQEEKAELMNERSEGWI
jgi:hypothetical protein